MTRDNYAHGRKIIELNGVELSRVVRELANNYDTSRFTRDYASSHEITCPHLVGLAGSVNEAGITIKAVSLENRDVVWGKLEVEYSCLKDGEKLVWGTSPEEVDKLEGRLAA